MSEKFSGAVHIAEEVVASVASLAACEVDGVASLAAAEGERLSELVGKQRGLAKGVKLSITGETVAVDVFILVKYGSNVRNVAQKVQENIKRTLESMTGMTVSAVNVHVNGISLKKDSAAK
ncbi:MAG: Asp23/Gls24 family envelope stress response protein [Oscillospiraceae bacterium]|nr:Asp23/Gls24 family envelope stress response protein [Oscillospiraceae bacterium]